MTRAILALTAMIASGYAFAMDAARAEPEVQPAYEEASAAKVRRAADSLPNFSLPAPSGEAVPKRMLGIAEPGTPLQVGFGRSLEALATSESMSARIDWIADDEGRWIGALSVTSQQASALRVGLQVQALPAGALLRFHAPAGGPVFQVSAEEVGAAIDRNVQAGDAMEAALTWWSPVIESDTIAIEIELPPGAVPSEARIALPMLSHLTSRPSSTLASPKAAADCEIDAMCHQAAWSLESSAVARIVYTRDGSSFVCSGTLLADKDPASTIPYFLTANHCISSQSAASSIQSYWFYRSNACDSGLRGSFQTRLGGATLLYGAQGTDTALLRMNSAPPVGAGYAGWLAASRPAGSIAMTGLHHPTGDLQKISFGNLQSFWNCVPADKGEFSCTGASPASATFFTVAWSRGITEPGSSGSGIFLDDGRYLVGQLYGGSNSCDGSGNRDWYGRFDVAYNAAMYRWLGATQSSAPGFTPSQPYTDLWWNPAESGWGMSLTQHGALIYGAWYVYDAAGRPSWLVMPGGQWLSTTQYRGELFSANGPDPRGPFDPANVARTRVGSATLAFEGADRLQLLYNVEGTSGARTLERQRFGPVAPALATNYSDLWWNPVESGWGLSITQQHQTLFAVWYAYGADRQPTWYVMPGGSWTAPDTYNGLLYRTSAAPAAFFASRFNAASVSRTHVGNMTLRFDNADNARMSWTIDGMSGSKAIARQPF